eukprot:UN13099
MLQKLLTEYKETYVPIQRDTSYRTYLLTRKNEKK